MERYQGNLTIDQIEVGQEYKNLLLNTMSTVISKTGNSVEMYNKADKKNVDSAGHKKGIDCKNWYEISGFNRMFK